MTEIADVLTPPTGERGDYWPALIIGITSAASTVWWIVSWFVFIKNSPGDFLLRNVSGQQTMPLLFFWERIAQTNGEFIYLAGSLLFTFFTYMVVSVVELIAWIFYMIGEPGFFAWYASVVGLYGSIVLYNIPVMFAIMHIAITLKMTITATPGSYLIFLIAVGSVFWILNVFVHVYFSERLVMEVRRQVGTKEIQCEISQGSMSDEQYKIACAALSVNKQDEEDASSAIDTSDDDVAADSAGW
jgi:hypothetical protein